MVVVHVPRLVYLNRNQVAALLAAYLFEALHPHTERTTSRMQELQRTQEACFFQLEPLVIVQPTE